ncbi:MAG: hypothetical protein LC776_00715 [Acidobacteria bacterium]|nr:hypothetical protein [Acidobacteriota bacterium]
MNPRQLLSAYVSKIPLVVSFRSAMGKGLCATDDERRRHIQGMRAAVEDTGVEKVHAWLHTNLIILDAKAQAILAMYSLALTALTVLYAGINDQAPFVILMIAALAFMVIAWSIIPLARICFVYWSTTDEFVDSKSMLENLLRVRDKRTQIVRKAVVKGILTIVLFGVLIGWDVLRRL